MRRVRTFLRIAAKFFILHRAQGCISELHYFQLISNLAVIRRIFHLIKLGILLAQFARQGELALLLRALLKVNCL